MPASSQTPPLPAGTLRIGNVIANHRISASRVLCAAFVAVLLASQSMHAGKLFSGVVFLAAVVLAGAAAVGRCWCALYISGHKNAELVTSGPYSICRNPLYFFSLVGMAGVGLATETLTLGIALPVMFAPVYLAVVRREEAFLRQRFGAPYEAYCERTPRFLPRLALLGEPTTYQVNPQVFGRALRDLVWFPWGVGLVHLVVSLHELGLLGAALRLP